MRITKTELLIIVALLFALFLVLSYPDEVKAVILTILLEEGFPAPVKIVPPSPIEGMQSASLSPQEVL